MNIFSSWFKPRVSVGDTKNAVKEITNAVAYPQITIINKGADELSVIKTCCKIIANDFARMPIKIYRTDSNGNRVVLKDDYRYKLLHIRPNDWTNPFKFWNTVEYNRSFTGNTYVKIIRGFANKPEGFVKIDNSNVISANVIGNQLVYSIKNGDTIEQVNSYDLLVFSEVPEISNNNVGSDPSDVLKQNVSILYKGVSTIDNSYSNSARPSMILEQLMPTSNEVSPKAWLNAMDEFNEKYKGFQYAGETYKSPPFTKLTPINYSLLDAQVIETIKWNTIQIANFYRIPPYMVGISEISKFNSLLELQQSYVRDTLGPIITSYRRELEFKLLTDEEINDGYSIEFETKALLETDIKTRSDYYDKMSKVAGMSPNEIRLNENLPSFEGGDDHYITNQSMSVEVYKKKNNELTPKV